MKSSTPFPEGSEGGRGPTHARPPVRSVATSVTKIDVVLVPQGMYCIVGTAASQQADSEVITNCGRSWEETNRRWSYKSGSGSEGGVRSLRGWLEKALLGATLAEP